MNLPSAPPPEGALRATLGIPPEAKRVLVLGETSHWDPNWLHTTEEYYRLCIPGILDRVLDALEAQPRRVFAIESLFFLQRYWQKNPHQHERLRGLVNQRRLRLCGTGITTPDTVLPETEAIFRDYADGQHWLAENGMTVEPRLAYLPDDFGHSPALPTLLDFGYGLDRPGYGGHGKRARAAAHGSSGDGPAVSVAQPPSPKSAKCST